MGSMYEKGGLLASEDGAFSILAGSTLGEHGAACCLPTPGSPAMWRFAALRRRHARQLVRQLQDAAPRAPRVG